MLSGSDNIAYVMDDGLTSFYGGQAMVLVQEIVGFYHGLAVQQRHITFIGTGFRLNQNSSNVTDTAQCSVDGVQIQMQYQMQASEGLKPSFWNSCHNRKLGDFWWSTPTFDEFTFFNPNVPPIPEDHCVLADYVTMADFVRQSDPTSSTETGKYQRD